MGMPQQPVWRLECMAERARLPELLALVRSACAAVQAPPDFEDELLLLAEEACVNVMMHAYPPGLPGPLALRVRRSRRGVELRLQDQGVAFDPLALPAPDLTASAEARAVGGLGVHLIRRFADRLHYRRDAARGNLFTIEKYLPST